MRKLIIIDLKKINGDYLKDKDYVIYWNNLFLNKEKRGISILDFVEDNSDNIKEIYLDWIDKIGNIEINGIPIYKQLEIRENYSYWWHR